MNKQQRYVVWRKVLGFVPMDGYMTADKPYTQFGYEKDAKTYTRKQAAAICRVFNNESRTSEVWGYNPARS